MNLTKISVYWYWIFGTGIFLVDQGTKSFMRIIEPNWTLVPQLLIISPLENTGIAFALEPPLWFVEGVGVLFVLGMITWLIWFKPVWWAYLGGMIMMTGAAGNLYDRLVYGAVTDFISVWAWPVFNVADVCISLGGGILILGEFIRYKTARKNSTLPYSKL